MFLVLAGNGHDHRGVLGNKRRNSGIRSVQIGKEFVIGIWYLAPLKCPRFDRKRVLSRRERGMVQGCAETAEIGRKITRDGTK
ncbi:hypothetical protein [Celeribacter sp.]|uniref:hypothetical protein n=1 Tax=Celeribacter sp. TaxID=1890673 RepID=UPI003A8D8D79